MLYVPNLTSFSEILFGLVCTCPNQHIPNKHILLAEKSLGFIFVSVQTVLRLLSEAGSHAQPFSDMTKGVT